MTAFCTEDVTLKNVPNIFALKEVHMSALSDFFQLFDLMFHPVLYGHCKLKKKKKKKKKKGLALWC